MLSLVLFRGGGGASHRNLSVCFEWSGPLIVPFIALNCI